MPDGHITVGFPRMHREASERRDFLPPLIGLLAANGAEVYLETGIGSGMGYSDTDYSTVSPAVHITDEEDCYRQDIVVVLRAPEGRYDLLRRGAVLVSMLHFATRPARVAMLRRARHRRAQPRPGQERGRSATGREPAQRRVERRRRRVRRA